LNRPPRLDWRRLLTWPARRAYRELDALRRGRLYGFSRPGWWPRERAWPFGPIHPHDGRQVTVMVGGQHYPFVPVTYGRYRGHMYAGRLRPSAAELAGRLQALGLDPGAAILLAAVSGLEGGFDAVQTYGRARFAWGFIQFTGLGGLPLLMQRIHSFEPERFERYFRASGIDCEPGRMVVIDGRQWLRGWRALNRLHDEPRLWKPFLLAGQDPAIQDVQIRAAYEHYLLRARALTVRLAGQSYTLGALMASQPLGEAFLFDTAVAGGLAHTARLFRRAARAAAARSPEDAAGLLTSALALEPNYLPRWAALQRALAGQLSVPQTSIQTEA
jgi:hypothetical protein